MHRPSIMRLDSAVRMLLENRYLLPGETPEQLFRRVAVAVDTPRATRFRSMMKHHLFLPNSPTLMNAGTPEGQLSACFVLPVEDSISSIFSALHHMALIHKTGGGTGFSFSHLRPSGDRVSGKDEVASGPLPFIHVFDEATNALRQGGRRRGANMGILSSSHPDILDFVTAKRAGGLRNFNLSVGFDTAFFDILSRGGEYDLFNPRDGYSWSTIDSGHLWRVIGESAWQSGDPGILFMDRINEANPVPGLGPIEATNPCGEQPLLPYESCNLGSINLSRCIRKGEIDQALLVEMVRLGIEFLDVVIDINRFPIGEIREMTGRTRKIGLGVMGLADALIRCGIPYESHEALEWTGRVLGWIQEEAHAKSRELGEEKGSFPAIDQSVFSGPMRNATVTTISPTGSLHLIAGTSSGIEPLFSLAFERVIQGRRVRFVHSLLRTLLADSGGGNGVLDHAKRTGSVQDLHLPESVKELLKTAPEISPEHHVRMQAVAQRYVDNAVSKTVNLPEKADVDEICSIFLLARKLGCKGITVYRYNSRSDQVLTRGCDLCLLEIPRTC
jgi:ribonucleoside-diphosphate reductase alpha chain